MANILAFDTSMGACSAAVIIDAGGVGARVFRGFEERARGHAEALMPMIAGVMHDAALDFYDLDRIAVTRGPGSFTGVRVGVAAARGLALSCGAPLVSETSLRVLALTYLKLADSETPSRSFDVLAVVSDARRGEVYAQFFNSTGEALGAATASSAADLVAALPAGRVLAIGSGGALIAGALEAGGRVVEVLAPDLQPDAVALGFIARDLSVEEAPLTPLYLRPPDAKPQTGKAVERLS